jgi:tetratricopeptide (TPR) repeat protein
VGQVQRATSTPPPPKPEPPRPPQPKPSCAALAEDLFFGPAHNNLGVVFLNRGDLYAAANEFEWARKLMPGHPDPRLNLAITLDRAGQVDEALSAYTATLEVYPGHIGAIQGLARVAVREGRRGSGEKGGSGGDEPRLEEWLRRIAIEGESEAWREWARGVRKR